mgnify:CR=1 FL=1
MSNSFSDAVNKILSENKSIDINQSGKTLVEKVNDVQIDRDGQDKFHQEKKLLGPSRFKKWFKRRTLKKSDMTDQEQEQHHQDNRKLAAAGVKDSVEYTGEPMNETHAPGSVEMVYGKHKVINTGNEDRYGFEMYDVHKGGKRTHNNVRLSTAKKVLDDARKKTTEKANRKLENPKESVEVTAKHDDHIKASAAIGSGTSRRGPLAGGKSVGDKKYNLRFDDEKTGKKFMQKHGFEEDVEQVDEVIQQFDHDNTGQKVGYTNKKLSDDQVSKLRKKYPQGSVEKDNDGNHVVYTGQYRKESVEVDESNFGYRSAKVRGPIDVTVYRDSHGKRPYHAEEGNWYFSAEPGGKPVHKSGPNTKYRDAKKGAEKFARENNHKKLYVMSSYDATSAADDFLNELSQEFGAENITLDTIMENISELETLLTSLKEYFGVEGNKDPVTILSAEEQASTDDPYEQHTMAVQKLKDIINKERNEETTKESNNGK